MHQGGNGMHPGSNRHPFAGSGFGGDQKLPQEHVLVDAGSVGSGAGNLPLRVSWNAGQVST
jgi:hypothetical protein